MVDFKPDRDLETKEMRSAMDTRSPRAVYNGWPTWARTLAKIIVGLLILILAVIIGRAIHHAVKDNNNSKKPSTNQVTTRPSNMPAPKSTSTSGNGSSTSKTSNKTPSNSTKQVPDTGPGDVAGLFAGASAIGASGHYLISRRKR